MKIRDWDRSLKVRLIGEFFMNTSYWMVFPFLAIYFAEEFGKGTAGLLLVISQMFSVASNLVGGYCADRFGRRRMLVVASTAQGLSFLLFAFANSPWLQSPELGFVAFTLAGMCGALYWPASQAMIADVVPEKYRSDVFAIFYTTLNIAVVVGPLFGAILFFSYRFELLLVVTVISMLLSVVLRLLTKETLSQAMVEKWQSQTATGWVGAISKQFKEYGLIFKDRLFLLFIIAGVLGAQTFMQLDLLIPVYLRETIDSQTVASLFNREWSVTGETSFGLLLAENGLFVALLTVVVTRWMTKFPEKWVFFTSAAFYGLAMWLFPLTDWFWMFVIAMAVFTFAELMVVGLQQNFISKLAPEDMRGQYFAAASLRYTIGRMIAPISIPMTAWFGFPLTFGVLGLLALASGFVYLLMFRLYEKRPSY
ncbi:MULTISPECIES: MFS transporter [Planococcus]|uniref:MFS transporter n=1 Tax=Planococcus faecalis TaxID=1598147 RepID=A0ABN4XTG7_9BACL|nr:MULTISPECIES: MFS transporter [Planococcus]AQU81103.1 MFS transporter [Planococcus faecalis]MDJ0330256.1 MFS transporter [Planococcus sp. S3-L1]OHX54847.1 MFS transporter [Planococcus faecalis]